MDSHKNLEDSPPYQSLLALHSGIQLSAHGRRRASIGALWCTEQVLLARVRAQCSAIFSQNPLSTLARFRTHSYPCGIPVGQLKGMGVGELRVEKKHLGGCLVVRNVERATVVGRQRGAVMVVVVVEDESGSRVPVRVYHSDAVKGVGADMRVGWVFIIKEPLYKVMDDGTCAVRVDHISDIVPLGNINESMIPVPWRANVPDGENTVLSWVAKGNKTFKAENDQDAIFSYTKALEFCNDKEHISSIQINRAQAYLRVKCHDDALADLASVLSKHPNHQKAHSRAGRALYELGRFEGCNAHLKKLRPSSINKRDRSYMGRLKEREREALGSYDFDTMRKEPTYDSPFLDHANFQGPVEARRSGERGRGLFLTRDVKAGHLLLCEKAFSSIFEDPKSYPKLFTDEHAAEKDRLSQEAKISLTDDIVQKLFHNPSLSPGFLDLHRGSYPLGPTPPKEIGPVIDTFLIGSILPYNCFGFHLTTLLRFQEWSSLSPFERSPGTCVGIWKTASLVNHACVPNASRAHFGDMIVVHAARDISKDEELTFSYFPATLEYSERQKHAGDYWDGGCGCEYCGAEAATPELQCSQRAKLVEEMHSIFAAFEASAPDKELTERLYQTITTRINLVNNTYTAIPSRQPRVQLLPSLQGLLYLSRGQNRPADTISSAIQILTTLGYEYDTTNARIERWGLMNNHVVEALAFLWEAYGESEEVKPELCGRAEENAKLAYEICIGERESFEEVLGEYRPELQEEDLEEFMDRELKSLDVGRG